MDKVTEEVITRLIQRIEKNEEEIRKLKSGNHMPGPHPTKEDVEFLGTGIQNVAGKFFKDGERLASQAQVDLILREGGYAKFGETKFYDVSAILEEVRSRKNSQHTKPDSVIADNGRSIGSITEEVGQEGQNADNYIDHKYTPEQIEEFPDY